MKLETSVLIVLLSLTGCSTANFDSLACPDVVEYTLPQMQLMARELSENDLPALTEAIRDYCVMRDQARICRGKEAVCTAN